MEVSTDVLPIISEDPYHPALKIFVCIKKEMNNNIKSASTPFYNFRKGNFYKLYQDLNSTDWSFLYEYADVNDAVESFYNSIYKILNNSVPKIKPQKKYTLTGSPWTLKNYQKKKSFQKMKSDE